MCNQLDTKPKSQTQASPIAWLGHGQASEQGSEPEKKGSNGQTPQTQQQKNVPSTARGKLERKRKTWSKSGAGTNYPRYSAPIPKRWLSDQRKNSAKEAHQPLRSFQLSSPAQSRTGPPSANEHTGLLKQSASMAGSTADMVKSLGRFRRPGASSLGHQREKLNVLSRASCSSVEVPLLVVRVHLGSRGPTLRAQDIQPLGRRNGEINCGKLGGRHQQACGGHFSRHPAAGATASQLFLVRGGGNRAHTRNKLGHARHC